MSFDLEKCKFRFLKGKNCLPEESICSIEYQTGTGMATVHGAILFEDAKQKEFRFIQQDAEWIVLVEQEQYSIEENSVEMLLQQENISLKALRESSKAIQEKIKK